jgi:hypothetical protein
MGGLWHCVYHIMGLALPQETTENHHKTIGYITIFKNSKSTISMGHVP